MVTIHLTSKDLVETRFAFSPMWEVSKSYRVLRNPTKHSLYLQWVREAKEAIDDADLRYLHALIGPESTDYVPDFLNPAFDSHGPTFEEELGRIEDTAPETIRKNVRMMLEWRELQSKEEQKVVQHYLDDPTGALDRLVKSLRTYWQRTLVHHWPRIRTVLEGDVLRRSRQLALEGPGPLFGDLHRFVTYEEETLRIDKHFRTDLTPSEPGLTLVPVLFSWPDLYLIIESGRQPAIGYSPRGAGLWDTQSASPSEALSAVIGEARASVLMALITPSTTGEIADRLNRTAGAISQQLSRLKEAGLVEGLRQGRYKYYRLTGRGEKLIDVFSAPG